MVLGEALRTKHFPFTPGLWRGCEETLKLSATICAPSAALICPEGLHHFHNGNLEPKYTPYFLHDSADRKKKDISIR